MALSLPQTLSLTLGAALTTVVDYRVLVLVMAATARTYLCDVCGGLDELVALAEKRLREAGG